MGILPSRLPVMQQTAARFRRVGADRFFVWFGAPAERVRNNQVAVLELRN